MDDSSPHARLGGDRHAHSATGCEDFTHLPVLYCIERRSNASRAPVNGTMSDAGDNTQVIKRRWMAEIADMARATALKEGLRPRRLMINLENKRGAP